jgi:hypothetical protein
MMELQDRPYICMLQMVMKASMCSLLLYNALGIPYKTCSMAIWTEF